MGVSIVCVHSRFFLKKNQQSVVKCNLSSLMDLRSRVCYVAAKGLDLVCASGRNSESIHFNRTTEGVLQEVSCTFMKPRSCVLELLGKGARTCTSTDTNCTVTDEGCEFEDAACIFGATNRTITWGYGDCFIRLATHFFKLFNFFFFFAEREAQQQPHQRHPSQHETQRRI